MLKRLLIVPALLALAGLAAVSATAVAFTFGQPFLGQFNTVTEVGTTVPSNGDVNPYGIVTVPASVGSLVRGDILISNFNNSENLQGTGTTIVQESPTGQLSLFAHIGLRQRPLRRRSDDRAGDPARRRRRRRQPADEQRQCGDRDRGRPDRARQHRPRDQDDLRRRRSTDRGI